MTDGSLKLVIRVLALVLVAAGLGYFLEPDLILSLTGNFQLDESARVDVRASYGGFQLGIGCYLLLASFKQRPVSSLAMIAVLFFCVGLLRFLAYSQGEAIGALHLYVAILELFCAGISWLLVIISRRRYPRE